MEAQISNSQEHITSGNIDQEMSGSQGNSQGLRKSQRVIEQDNNANQPASNQKPVVFNKDLYQEDDEGSSSEQEDSDKENTVEKEKKTEIKPSKSKYDQFLEEVKQREVAEQEQLYFGPEVAVDSFCSLKNVKVYQNYSAVLQRKDINFGAALSNDKMMRMQLLERIDAKKWTFWHCLGRIGTNNPAEKTKDFFSKIEAKAEFEKHFFKKTANKWIEKELFQDKPGKFVLLNEMTQNEIEEKALTVEKDICQAIIASQSQFQIAKIKEREIEQLIGNLFDIQQIKNQLEILGLDQSKINIGSIEPVIFTRSLKVLNKIYEILVAGAQGKELQLSQLTNDFYTLIPHNFGLKKAIIIDHIVKIKEKYKLLLQLNGLLTIQSILKEAQLDLTFMHSVDALYGKLFANLQLVLKEDNIFNIITSAVNNTQSEFHDKLNLHVQDVFQIQKSSEELRFMPFEQNLHNKFLLWTGIPGIQLPDVLMNGLKVQPRGYPSQLLPLGNGLYFTDCSSKAALQATSLSSSDNIFLMLSVVALGNMHQVYRPEQLKKVPDYYHSVYAVGTQKPKMNGIKDLKGIPEEGFQPKEETAMTPKALFLNCGKMSSNPDLKDLPPGMTSSDFKVNEFIVFDENQVKMAYLVKCSA